MLNKCDLVTIWSSLKTLSHILGDCPTANNLGRINSKIDVMLMQNIGQPEPVEPTQEEIETWEAWGEGYSQVGDFFYKYNEERLTNE